ncbi:hypothetical protein HW555_002472, partial [Spodoptera exigua]
QFLHYFIHNCQKSLEVDDWLSKAITGISERWLIRNAHASIGATTTKIPPQMTWLRGIDPFHDDEKVLHYT